MLLPCLDGFSLPLGYHQVKLGNHYTIMMLVSTPRGGKRKLEEHLVNPLSPVGQVYKEFGAAAAAVS